MPPGDDHVLADGPAPLGHNAAHSDRPLEKNPDGSVVNDLASKNESCLSGHAAAAGHAAQNAQTGMIRVRFLEKSVHRESERVAQQKNGGTRRLGCHDRVGPAQDADAVRRLFEHEMERLQLYRLRPSAQPQAHRWTPLDLLVVAENGFAAAPQQTTRI